MYIIIAIIVFGLLILVHEVGHYFVGKRAGIGIVEFSIGFGPKLFKWKRGETDFSLRLLPIGGFVRFLGEDEENSSRNAFNNATVWKRFVTILTGPVTNILLAFIVTFLVFLIFGNSQLYISEFSDNGNAKDSGLEVGDIVIGFDGKTADLLDEVYSYYLESGDTTELIVVRNNEIKKYAVEKTLIEGKKLLGLVFGMTRQNVGVLKSAELTFKKNIYIIEQTGILVGDLFSGRRTVSETVVGPVGAISYVATGAQYGAESLLELVAMLSLNLGIINLLPLPALDGGRLVFLIIEAIRKKPLSREKEGLIHMIGLVLFMLLFIFLTFNDITRLFGLG